MSLLAEPKGKSAGLLTGTSMIRVRNGQSRETVIRALAAEFGVTVAPVPRRYLLAKKAARARPGARMAPAAVPPAMGAAWHLEKTGTTAARAAAKFIEPKQVKVAVLDTGIDETHPLLKSRLARYFHTYNNLNVVSGAADIVGHGTHVAGTVAAMLDRLTGVCGMCDCKLTAMKIFDDTTEYIPQQGYLAYTVEPTMYLRAFLECADAAIQVVNLSIGGPAPPSAQEAQAINNLIGNGCVIVAAMGNERELGSRPSYPAAHPGIIAVGATDPGDRVTSFSNRGPHISLCAPGKGIWSTMPTYSGQYGFYPDMSSGSPKEGRAIMRDTLFGQEDGTSMASPQVAAAAAMYLAVHPAARPVDVRTALTDSAEKVPAMSGKSFHEDYGYGRLDVAALLG
jgi:subtilisin family serine protease